MKTEISEDFQICISVPLKNGENFLCTKNSEHFGDYPYFANLNTRTELVLFQQQRYQNSFPSIN